MALKPWYKVVTPREDLREGRPLDASEFAVHLDHVKEGRAPEDYQKPERFFERTFLTASLRELGKSVLRRLSGIKVETSAIYNLNTQFGGGKTHALTLLYHLAMAGDSASKWKGVPSILDAAQLKSVPGAAVAVFVGTEFDSLSGRGTDNEPRRFTPWGEIAFQLMGKEGFQAVAKHDQERTAPSGEVIRKFLPKDKPTLILLDELLNYMGRNRKSGLTNQLYSFIQNLSEEVRAHERVVLAVSLPSLLDEMTPEDEADFSRFQKVLDRLGKAMILSAETETSEIIRRRLFEWNILPEDAKKVADAYAEWVLEHRSQVPSWFPVDHAKEAFMATYPFHPTLLSVFERKWQALPRFQQTRGVLRLLALWVSRAYQDGFKGGQKDALIGAGTAPLDDPLFRSAAFEQLGGAKLEAAVTTDIAGKKDAHAFRLDKEAMEVIRKSRLHQKVATTIFFESNGGQAKAEATLPEIRLAVAEPEMDIGNVETVLETLSTSCYFLNTEKNRYRFSVSANLNKILADRKASVDAAKIDERMRSEVQKVLSQGSAIDRVFFPDKSNAIPDRPALTLVVLSPQNTMADGATRAFIESATRENGASARTFKSGLIWLVPDASDGLREETRKTMAWEDIQDEEGDLRLDESQKRQLSESVKKAQRDVREAVWRTYKFILLLAKDGSFRTIDMGLTHSSAANSLTDLVLSRLQQDDEIVCDEGVKPDLLVRHWPPALPEWSTRSVRDAFYASPQFPRLRKPDSLLGTIARGVAMKRFAYVGKVGDGKYDPFEWDTKLSPDSFELSDEVFLIRAEMAEEYLAGQKKPDTEKGKPPVVDTPTTTTTATDAPEVEKGGEQKAPEQITAVQSLAWSGEVPSAKWMKFYTGVLSKFATASGLKVTVRFEISPQDGVSKQKVEETRNALKDLGLPDAVETKK